ncbi:MAG TPA: hypothetical protein VE914_03070 [Candidatus Angelobacter sp.]|nr:hypothetical protein [Candidatus Angelobacter sp.]
MKLARTRTVAALLFAITLAGCAASKNPLGPASDAVSEPRLAGVWAYEGNNEGSEYLHILPSDDGKRLQIVAVNQGDKSWAVLDGYVIAVGERRFINVRLTAADAGLMADVDKTGHKDSHPYSFAAYAFDGDDRLTIGYPVEALYKAVKDGRLAGETSGDYDVFVADSAANIAAILGALDDAALFKEPKRYRRIKPPQ